MLTMRETWQVVKRAAIHWMDDKAPQLAAALAFYSMLSIGPLILIVTAIIGIVYGQEAASGQIAEQIRGLIGDRGAEAIQTLVASAERSDSGLLATLIGLGTLLFGAYNGFRQLQDAMNAIWKVPPQKDVSWWFIVQKRVLSFAMVLAIGFLLLVSMVISAILAALAKYFSGLLPDFLPIVELTNQAVTFGVITLLFALIFRVLPDLYVRWKEVWAGALVTAALFTVGKYAIGLYLGRSAVGSVYGAAGSLMVLLLWVYYSALIVFFGAELTAAYRHVAATRNKVEIGGK